MDNTRGLWRGKTTPKRPGQEFNETWVYGDRVTNGEKVYIHPQGNAFKVERELSSLLVVHEVDSGTLGEYTGLTDKNGKMIFEGDIVATQIRKPHEIKFCEGAFYIDGTSIPIRHVRVFTVIGNIHDNPELIGGQDG